MWISYLLIALCCVLSGFSDVARADGEGRSPGSGIAGVAAETVQQRQHQIQSAQTLFTGGSRALADKSYGEAMDYFKAAYEATPDVPATAEQRAVFFKRYQTASVLFAKQLIEQAEWVEAEKTVSDVMQLGRTTNVPQAWIDPEVRTILGRLKSKDYYDIALSPQHLRNVDKVSLALKTAQGYMDLGDYDRAIREYHKVLDLDPYNQAARMGMERVERHKMDYYDVARDQTRATKLREVAEGWEMPIPPDIDSSLYDLTDVEIPTAGAQEIEQKLKNITIPQLEFNDATLGDVIQFLIQKSQELDRSEADPAKRGVNIVVDASGAAGGGDPSQTTMTVRLTNVPLGIALKYVTQQVGMKYRVDNFAVTVIPQSVAADSVMITRKYPVPPDFIQGGVADGGGGAANNDPFAEPAGGDQGTLVKRISAQDFLEQRGVVFKDGALAQYIVRTSTLLVKNTADQLAIIDGMVAAARAGGSKMVRVKVKMISVGQEELNEKGLDHLLGQSNLGNGTPRVFAGGGTNGNVQIPVQNPDFPFVTPGGSPVGLNPVTGGLRTGDFRPTRGVDAAINQTQVGGTRFKAPGIFSVAGVFTDPQFQTVVRAVSQLKGTDLLCDSYVLVRPGQRAKIEQIREFIYPTEYDPPEIPNSFGQFQVGNVIYQTDLPATYPVTPATPTAFETRNVGKTLEVEPSVSADNRTVTLNLLTDFTDFTGFINYGTPIRNSNFILQDGSPSIITENRILMPVFDVVRETTDVVVWDGQTIVIGGFHGESVDNAQDKVPFFGDLPVLGRGFRSTSVQRNKRALLIFVSVLLVDPSDQPINKVLDPVDDLTAVPPPSNVGRAPLSAFPPPLETSSK